MAFHHHRRRWLAESGDDKKLLKKCENACDDIRDETCPRDCLDYCSLNCKTRLNRPPPSDDFDSGYKYNPADKASKASLFLNICLALLIISFFFFACYVVYKLWSNWWYHRSRRQERGGPEEEDESSPDGDYNGAVVDHHIWYIRTVGLQPSDISAIRVVKYKKGDCGLVEGTDCSVCLSEFQENEALRLLPKCNHAFHITCIDTWLTSHTNCPMCRAVIVISRVLPSEDQLIVQDSGLSEETNQTQAPDSESEGCSEIRIRIHGDGIIRPMARSFSWIL